MLTIVVLGLLSVPHTRPLVCGSAISSHSSQLPHHSLQPLDTSSAQAALTTEAPTPQRGCVCSVCVCVCVWVGVGRCCLILNYASKLRYLRLVGLMMVGDVAFDNCLCVEVGMMMLKNKSGPPNTSHSTDIWLQIIGQVAHILKQNSRGRTVIQLRPLSGSHHWVIVFAKCVDTKFA